MTSENRGFSQPENRGFSIIGNGSYGKIYLDESKTIPDVYKVTELDDNISWVREIVLMNNLHHPNIITIRKCGFDFIPSDDKKVKFANSNVYYTMPKYTMLRNVSPELLDDNAVMVIIYGLLDAISYLHYYNIIHRDIKEANIFVNNQAPNGIVQCYLGDFGSARFWSPKTDSLSPRCTTLSHRSPKLLLETNNYDVGIDVWSIGIVIFYLITRKLLYHIVIHHKRNTAIVDEIGNKINKSLHEEEYYRTFLLLENVSEIILSLAKKYANPSLVNVKFYLHVLQNCLNYAPSSKLYEECRSYIIDNKLQIDLQDVRAIKRIVYQPSKLHIRHISTHILPVLMHVKNIRLRNLLYNRSIAVIHYYSEKIRIDITNINSNTMILLLHFVCILYNHTMLFVPHVRGDIVQLMCLLMTDVDFFRDVLPVLITK